MADQKPWNSLPKSQLDLEHKPGKIWVKLSLYLIKHHAMKTYWGEDVLLHAFLTSTLNVHVWLDSHSGCFTPGIKEPGTHSKNTVQGKNMLILKTYYLKTSFTS
jgi:hypothetical protein